ncbi:MAG: hypothetical protein R3E89_10970 [Thiolinea sp.]
MLTTACCYKPLHPLQQLPAHVWQKTAIPGWLLLLLGHAGRRFWEVLQAQDWTALGPDPVDTFSARISERALTTYLPDIARSHCLFPTDVCPVNLMALGQAIGLHTPSHWAWVFIQVTACGHYRLMVAGLAGRKPTLAITTLLHAQAATTHICAQCQTRECLTACPAQAARWCPT